MNLNRRIFPRRSSKGQALVEFGLVLPLLFMLMLYIVNYGALLRASIVVVNAARSGAQYMVMGSAAPGSPALPTVTQVQALVTQDMYSLLGSASAQVCVCYSDTRGCSGSCAGIVKPTDPGGYVAGSVDVTYTFVPLVQFWWIGTATPQRTLHARKVMRLLQ